MTTIHFLDSSALIKLFVNESGSERLRSYIDPVAADDKAFSILAEVEARSALQRRLRNAEITMDQHSAAIERLSLISGIWLSVAIDESVIDFAPGVISRHGLRSLDALQLASALSIQEELVSGDILLFIATDKRLLNAAVAEGLITWNPETSAVPPVPPVN